MPIANELIIGNFLSNKSVPIREITMRNIYLIQSKKKCLILFNVPLLVIIILTNIIRLNKSI